MGHYPRAALASLGLPGRAIWPQADETAGQDIAYLRKWVSGLHGGAAGFASGITDLTEGRGA